MINNPNAYQAAEWLDYAACTAYGAAPMFPGEGDAEGIRAAKANCSVCPVLAECLTAALARNEQWGIWGGLTTEERKALRRKAQRSAKLITDLDLPDVA